MGDELEPAPFVSIGERVLADDHQYDRNIPTESKCQTDRGAPAPFKSVSKGSSQWLHSRLKRATSPADYAGTLKGLRRSLVLDDIEPGAVLFFHLFCRNCSAAKVCELRKLALDRL
jgi:hypothetical protein